MGVIEELNEVLGEDVLTRAFAQALEAQGSSPRMGVDEIEQRLGATRTSSLTPTGTSWTRSSSTRCRTW